jgi:hypothetical protein
MPRGFVDAGAHGTIHPEGETVGGSRGIPTTGIGGSTLGLLVGISGRMSPRVLVGIEAALNNRFTDMQRSGVAEYRHEYGEHFVSVLFRGHTARARGGFEGVGGLTIVRTRRTTTSTFVDILGRPTGTFVEEARDVRLGATGGFDIPVAVGRFAIAPGLRLTWVPRGEQNEFSLGLGSFVFRFGVTARLAF